MQVFTTANDKFVQAGRAPPYALRVVARNGARVTASSGLELATDALSPLDTLVIAGGPGVDAAAADTVLVDWVRGRVASVCTGAFLLAASGALDGRRATTHGSFCAELARRFPSVRVEPDPIFVRDGAVWASAGVTAGIDLALVEADLGRDVALAVARYLVAFLQRPGGQAQFSTALSLQVADDKFGALHTWISAHLDRDLSLPVLADQAAMSARSFSRHYHDAIGLTPARAVERAAGGGSAAAAVGVESADQADRAAMRVRLEGNTVARQSCACWLRRRRTAADVSANCPEIKRRGF